MARDQLPRVSVPMRMGPGSVSSPLQDVQIYRPGPYIALAILLLPALVTLGGAAIYLNTDTQIPGWLPFILLLWVPGFPVLWMAMLTVRTNSAGIASGRPWSRWVVISWQDIERAEQRGPFVRIEGAQGGRISFTPLLLHDGKRLERHLLLRLPIHVLTGDFARKAQGLLTSSIRSTPEGGYSGTLTVHVRGAIRSFLAVCAAASTVGAVYLLRRASFAIAVPLGAGLAVVAVVTCGGLLWSLQRVRITESGISIERAVIPATKRISWTEIELIERSPNEGFLRFRGAQRLFCVGPGFLSPAQANLMRGFLSEYAGKRKIPMFPRRWVLPW